MFRLPVYMYCFSIYFLKLVSEALKSLKNNNKIIRMVHLGKFNYHKIFKKSCLWFQCTLVKHIIATWQTLWKFELNYYHFIHSHHLIIDCFVTLPFIKHLFNLHNDSYAKYSLWYIIMMFLLITNSKSFNKFTQCNGSISFRGRIQNHFG